ncbi:ABC transporter substrate-binding protein [Paenibacillus hexagrammi]|uniref:Extracellular solute-binding protein n=1 Tax=Paenibacillus hexagrammi TaxID=2908839 RepID=A0ABY3SH04_9BACL|nr:extracellular solute-binding protein [Paenibacillus sp. YPD9-1]UJF32765.1 extracellular solute-binding protein [Paenibacillus sp. YPD9-1]
MASSLAVFAAGCGSSTNNTATQSTAPAPTAAAEKAAATEPAKKKDVSIKVFQFKVEIADALNKMAQEYEKETGVHVDIETHGGGEDYGALLKAEFASGSEPEIYNNGGYAALKPYMDRAVDLSNEPWAKDLIDSAKLPTTVDGKLYGMPMNTEGYGLIYNKDLFAKAGITETPKTLSQLTDAVKKLQAAGITPFETTNEWWSLGIHLVNVAFANQDNPAQFIEDLKAGKTTIKGNKQFEDWANVVDLIFKNAQKNMLTTDYATQVADFAAGKAAMMQQGNWVQGDIDKVNAKLNLGVLPLPINDKEGKVYIGVPNNWIVNSKSAHPDEAKKFLNWMVASETGKKYLTQEFKFMPAEKNIPATPEQIGQIAAATQAQAATALGWHWDRFADGTTQGFGAAMQEYQGGKINKDQLLEKLDKAVQDIVKK